MSKELSMWALYATIEIENHFGLAWAPLSVINSDRPVELTRNVKGNIKDGKMTVKFTQLQ